MTENKHNFINVFHNENLSSFILHISSENTETVKLLLKNRFENIDILLIKSKNGNGGTFLLHTIANELISKNEKITSVSWLQIKNYLKSKEIFEKFLFSTKFLIIDDADCLFQEKELSEWSYVLIQKFISGKGKIILSCDINSDFQESLKNFNLLTIETRYPPLSFFRKVIKTEIIKGNDSYDMKIFNRFADFLYEKANTMREFFGYFMSLNSLFKLGKLNYQSEAEIKKILDTVR